ncbi:MAG: hypothetical protein JXX29_09160 [Deltaproteobacteria bacterium]|nr:hypothetical protein [Deltaproteobacteria bacterium]MBN2671831.1 hypothetical protein [Deltaproteobacteria bacterium]
MKINRFLFTIICISFTCFSCSKYTYITAKQAKVQKGAKIAVVVWDSVSDESPSVLTDYLYAALTQKGHAVTIIDPNYLLGESLSVALYPEGEYSFGKSMTRGIEVGGKISGDADEIAATITERTEIFEANIRFQQLENLRKALANTDVDHLLIVRRFDFYGFSAQVVELSDFKIISSLTFQGNDIGFEKVVSQHNLGTKGMYAEVGDVSKLELLQMASLIASGL